MNTFKKQYGQFYTTNYKKILKGFNIPDDIDNIIEPFAGNCDLINFLENKNYNLELYDIDPQNKEVIKRDTLLNPPNYSEKFILTNPPYLARNKSNNKEIYDKYNQNDLYKCFIKQIINCKCKGGILIIPLNFFCSIIKNDINLRKEFLDKYSIIRLNIFEESIFEDTDYTICSFQFEINKDKEININTFIYPNEKNIIINSYIIGKELYDLVNNPNIKISRLTKENEKSEYKTNILVKCIDDKTKINAKYYSNFSDISQYIDKTDNLSFRSYMILVIEPKIDENKQIELVNKFNKFLNEKREQYHSLFLTNYRENNRKRISFSLVFSLINNLI